MKEILDEMPTDYQLRNRLGFRLSRISRMMQEQLELGLAQHGLTRMKWCILAGIALEGQGSPSELAEHIGVTRPVISRLLKSMISEGLVARNLSQCDGRARDLEVTEQGLEKVRLCWPEVKRNQMHFLGKLSDEQREQLDLLLNLLTSGEEKPLRNL